MGFKTVFHYGHLMLSIMLSFFIVPVPLSSAYPLTIKLRKRIREKCFGFDIPEDDDARIVVVPISDKDTDETLDYYTNMMSQLQWDVNELPQPPKQIQKNFHGREVKSGVYVVLKRFPSKLLSHYPLVYHRGIFFKSIANMGYGSKDSEAYTQHFMCFDSRKATGEVKLMFDLMLKSDYEDALLNEAEKVDRKAQKVVKKSQFKPLEANLETSVNKANRIVNTMRYMEKREARMRETSESTQNRIKKFSYLSIAVMLATTFFQAVYLKNYFKKKKAL